MRLTIKFFSLILLLVIATFPYSGSMKTMNDDTGMVIEETGNPCFEGCVRGHENCKGKCGLNAGCIAKCDDESMKCQAKCN